MHFYNSAPSKSGKDNLFADCFILYILQSNLNVRIVWFGPLYAYYYNSKFYTFAPSKHSIA